MKSQKMKRLWVIAIAVAAVAVALPIITYATPIEPATAWYTDNPDADVFTLNNRADFAGLAAIVNEGEEDFYGKTVRLSDSFGGHFLFGSFPPIGGQGDTAFDGIFDGNGKTINYFTVDTDGLTKNLGVFGHAGPHSVIKDLSVGNAAILEKSLWAAEASPIENVGLLVGYSEGSLENCSAAGGVTVEHSMNQTAAVVYPIRNVGGLAGVVLGDVTGCANSGRVEVQETGYAYKAAEGEEWADTTVVALNIGGVVGCAGDEDSSTLDNAGDSDESAAARHGTLTDVTNTGSVVIDTPNENG